MLPAVAEQVFTAVGRTATLDACTGVASAEFCCNILSPAKRSFLRLSPDGHCVFIAPPAACLLPYLRHYMAARARDPSTCAVVLTPSSTAASARFCMARMRLVHTFAPGSLLFNKLDAYGRLQPAPPISEAYEVWWDAPAADAAHLPSPRLSALQLNAAGEPVSAAANALSASALPLFAAKLCGSDLVVLADTGATDDFIGADQLQGHKNLKLLPCAHSHVTLADGGRQTILGQVSVRLCIGPLRVQLHPYVLPQLSDSAGFLLGAASLTALQGSVNLAKRHLRLCKDSLVYRAPFLSASALQKPSANYAAVALCAQAVPERIGRKQVARELRKGAHALLVTPVSRVFAAAATAVSDTAASAPAPSSATDPEVAALLAKFSDVFEPLSGIPPERPVDHTIELVPDAVPVARPQYRLSEPELAEVKRQVTALLANGMIRPSTSPFAAPILFVGKKDGTLRMCLDYRGLNAVTVRNRYPLPRIDDLLDKLRGCSYFSCIDLQQGYHQLRIRESDIPKTAFRTPFGSFEYVVLPFGLCNAPHTFQAAMDRIFGPFLNKFVFCYLDDLCIASRSKQEHLQHLELVLSKLREAKLQAKLSKCSWAQPQVEYLGHIVSADGVRMDPKKTAAVRDWPVPKSATELRGFLGLANYFRKFIRNLSGLAAPLHELTGNSVRWTTESWTPTCQAAFEAIKRAVAEDIVLRYPDPSEEYRLELVSDASLQGTGAVLLQGGRPIAFHSKKFTPAEKNYTTGEQELLGVIHALREWRCYLEGTRPFTLVTDHKPLTFLQGVPVLSRRQARWMEFLSRFEYNWLYRKGSLNVADALSRHPSLHAAILAMPAIVERDDATLYHRIRTAYATDDTFVSGGGTRAYSQTQGLWVRKDGTRTQIVVPNDDDIRRELLDRFHSGPLGGHVGSTRLFAAVRNAFWWPTLARDAERYVAACPACQLSKDRTGKPAGLLQPLPVPEKPWSDIALDFVVGLPKTAAGHDSLLVVIDRLTKMTHVMPTTQSVTAEQTAQLLFENVIRLHGAPRRVVSDRGSVFTSNFWSALASRLGIRLNLSTAYHPQTDGQTERQNRVVTEMLRCYCGERMHTWDQYLPAVEFALNNAVNRVTKQTPFFLNYGFHPTPPALLEVEGPVPAADAYVQDFATRIADARRLLDAAQQRVAAYENTGRVDAQYKPGQLVKLHTANLRKSVRGPRKLLARWVGPFPVEHMVGNAAVKLRLPTNMKVHPTFHVSLVKPWVSSADGTNPPPVSWDCGDALYEVEAILDYRRHKVGSRYIDQWKVRWAGYSEAYDQWEPAHHFTPDWKPELERVKAAVRQRSRQQASRKPVS